MEDSEASSPQRQFFLHYSRDAKLSVTGKQLQYAEGCCLSACKTPSIHVAACRMHRVDRATTRCIVYADGMQFEYAGVAAVFLHQYMYIST